MYGFPNCEGILIKNFTFIRLFSSNICFLSKDCNCNVDGSENAMVCDSAGHCTCKPNVDGYKCDKCAANQYGFPNCQGKIFIHFLQFQMMFQRVMVNYRGTHLFQIVIAMSKAHYYNNVIEMANVLVNPQILVEQSVINVLKDILDFHLVKKR